jgi:hypothetical protein
MSRRILAAGLAAGALALGGCATTPATEPGVVLGEAPPAAQPNPTFIALGPDDYGAVFEAVLDVLDDYFEIAQSNRYDGRIRTFPRVAPGLEQPWRPGSPDSSERFLVTLQSYAYVGDVVIQPGENGGYLIFLTVTKYLEDLWKPLRATAGAAAFRSDNSIDRRNEVVDPNRPDAAWIPKGREPALEQRLLQKIEDRLTKR